jgi:lysophospholipase L1-like esterase
MIGEVWIEYEYVDATVPNLLFLGHSYVDAAQFTGTPGQYGQPTGFAQKFSRRHKAAVSVNALSTSKLTDWVNGTTISNKLDILTAAQGYNFDGIVVMLAGNDIVNDAATPTAATLLTRFQNLVNALAVRYPGVPVFAATNTPFGAVGDTTRGSGGKAVTQAMLDAQDGFNAGLFATIRGLAGVLDFESVLRDPASPRRPLAGLIGNDGIHPNPRGYDALADAITIA